MILKFMKVEPIGDSFFLDSLSLRKNLNHAETNNNNNNSPGGILHPKVKKAKMLFLAQKKQV